MVGKAYGGLLARAGHDVTLSFTSDLVALQSYIEGTEEARLHFGEPAEALKTAQVVIFSPRFEHIDLAIEAAGGADAFAGKIVVDTGNAFTPTRDGVVDLDGKSALSELSRRLPGVRVVKAFANLSIGSAESRVEQPIDRRLVIFIAGDDLEAKSVAAGLVVDTGFAPLDTGGAETASLFEAPGPLFNKPVALAEAREALTAAQRQMQEPGQ